MSDSDPRPSFRWNWGSSRGGMRSRSMRAFIRRMSATSASVRGRSQTKAWARAMKRSSEVAVTGHHAGPEQSLAFPGLGPALEVGLIAGQVAGQTSLAPFGPEAQVDGGHPLRRTGSVDETQESLGHLLAPLVVAGGGVVEDEEHIEVAGIGHLGPAQPAHAHHAEGDVGGHVDDGRLENGLGHGGEGRSRGGDVVDVEKVTGGDAQRLVLGEPHQAGPPAAFVPRAGQTLDGVIYQGRPAARGPGPGRRRARR